MRMPAASILASLLTIATVACQSSRETSPIRGDIVRWDVVESGIERNGARIDVIDDRVCGSLRLSGIETEPGCVVITALGEEASLLAAIDERLLLVALPVDASSVSLAEGEVDRASALISGIPVLIARDAADGTLITIETSGEDSSSSRVLTCILRLDLGSLECTTSVTEG
jgi:hypothetical protein